jgi:2-furoyl-CoA dehydrogenase large subunit
VVDPSATNIGYVGLATPASQRAAGRGRSGSTELVRISVDPGGIVSVLLGTVPQGQGHATVARQVVARRLGLPLEQVQVVVEMDDQLCGPSQALGPMGKKDIHERY